MDDERLLWNPTPTNRHCSKFVRLIGCFCRTFETSNSLALQKLTDYSSQYHSIETSHYCSLYVSHMKALFRRAFAWLRKWKRTFLLLLGLDSTRDANIDAVDQKKLLSVFSCIYSISQHWVILGSLRDVPDLTGQISKESSRYPIAQGSFGDVWKCTSMHAQLEASDSFSPCIHESIPHQVAVKCLRIEIQDDGCKEEITKVCGAPCVPCIRLLNHDNSEAQAWAPAEHPAETRTPTTITRNNTRVWPATCNGLPMDAQWLPYYASGAQFPTRYHSKAANRECLLSWCYIS